MIEIHAKEEHISIQEQKCGKTVMVSECLRDKNSVDVVSRLAFGGR